MFGIDLIAIIALVVVAWRQQQRLRALQGDVDQLRKAFVAQRGDASAPQAANAAAEPEAAPTEGPWSAQAQTSREAPAQPIDSTLTEALAAVPPGAPEQVAAAAEAALPEAPAG